MTAATPAPGASVAARDADDVAAAVLACPTVAGLHGGGSRRIATYLPARRVDGVRLDEDSIDVAVVAVHGARVTDLAREVRTALAPYARGRAVNVHIADVDAPI